jgi:hypothetical protein
MILLEQHIELKIYHFNALRKYEVIEMLKDDEGMSFTIFRKDKYLFTLIPKITDYLTFELAEKDKTKDIDWNLFLKIEASLFSIFLKGPAS